MRSLNSTCSVPNDSAWNMELMLTKYTLTLTLENRKSCLHPLQQETETRSIQRDKTHSRVNTKSPSGNWEELNIWVFESALYWARMTLGMMAHKWKNTTYQGKELWLSNWGTIAMHFAWIICQLLQAKRYPKWYSVWVRYIGKLNE